MASPSILDNKVFDSKKKKFAKAEAKLPPSGEDEVGKGPLVTDDKGNEVVPEIRKNRTPSEMRNKLYGKDK